MAKKRTKIKGEKKVLPLQYWIHEGTGRVGIGRGPQHAQEKREAGFREVGPATFKRFVMEAQARSAAKRDEVLAEKAGLV